MHMRQLRLGAVVAVVLVSLTGFKSHGHGHGGGGCSSSKSHHGSSGSGHTSTSHYRPRPRYTPSGQRPSVNATIASCAGAGRPASTVELRSSGTGSGSFAVTVHFLDAKGAEVDTHAISVTMTGYETTSVQVPMVHATAAGQVRSCRVDPVY